MSHQHPSITYSSAYGGIFDTHAHYDDEDFDPDRAGVLGALAACGVSHVLNCGSSLASSERSVRLAHEYGFIRAAVGVHPHEAEHTPADTVERLRALACDEKVAAIGEIGFDYSREPDKDAQRLWFERQMELAAELGLPVIIHDRDAHADCIAMARQFAGKVRRGIFHCYSGSAESAREVIAMGYYIAIGGICTFTNARRSLEVAASIPEDRLLLETDCPYLAPHPYRGERNDSRLLYLTLEALARARGTDPQRLADVTRENGMRVFGERAAGGQ